MEEVGLVVGEGNPILAVRTNAKFSFVEMNSIENCAGVCDRVMLTSPGEHLIRGEFSGHHGHGASSGVIPASGTALGCKITDLGLPRTITSPQDASSPQNMVAPASKSSKRPKTPASLH